MEGERVSTDLREPQAFERFLSDLRDGDNDARRRLFRECYSTPYVRARRLLRDPCDAEDIAMGVLVDFMERLVHRFRGTSIGALHTYLGVAALDRGIRYRDRQRALLSGPDPEDHASSEPGERDVFLLRRLEECLRKLPPIARRILRLKYSSDKDNPEIATLLGISRAAVSQRLTHRGRGALPRLRKCLDHRPSRPTLLQEDSS